MQELPSPLERADEEAPAVDETDPKMSFLSYTAGLVFALLLTGASFFVARSPLIWSPGVPVGLAVLAIAQMGVHLVFFLHITTGPDNLNNALALALGVLIVGIVIAGSLWIMYHMNMNMMPPSDM